MAESRIDKVRIDFTEKLRVAGLQARLQRTSERVAVDGADAPNPERIYIQGAIDTGLTPEEYGNLRNRGWGI